MVGPCLVGSADPLELSSHAEFFGGLPFTQNYFSRLIVRIMR